MQEFPHNPHNSGTTYYAKNYQAGRLYPRTDAASRLMLQYGDT
jgi:hypothetical protein